MRRRADRKREAAQDRHPAIEAHQLHRDLALVVIHRQHRIERAILGAQENGVGRKRPFRRYSLSPAGHHGGFDHIDLLAAEIATVAGMRVEPGHRDPGRGKAGPPHAGIGQFQRAMDTFDGEKRGHVLERDVRGDARIP